jgi:Mg/Co/Ni transporter MgtE
MEMNESRASGGSPFKQMESRIKMQQKQTYNSIQHEKTIEMLSRINNEKMRRQEKIVHEMKKKQEKEIQKLVEIENNKSHLQLHRQSRANPLLKFNTKEIENL